MTSAAAPAPSRPLRTLPAEAWDCHVHVFGDPAIYPFAGNRRYTPRPAGTDALQQALARLGATRAVIVQASPYGTDNRSLVDALTALNGRALGVANLHEDARTGDAELAGLQASGVRGARIHLAELGGAVAETCLRRALAQLRGSGWHLDVRLRSDQLPLVAKIAACGAPDVVLDHFAGLSHFEPDQDAESKALAAAMEGGHVWLKLSAPYRLAGASDAARLAANLYRVFPERCVWGSDWPHTPLHPDAAQRLDPIAFRHFDAGRSLDDTFRLLDDDAVAAIMAHNPDRLYNPA